MAAHERFPALLQDFPLQALDDDCRLLGSLLDDTLRIEVGDVLFEKIERIRSMAQAAASLGQSHAGDAATLLHSLMERELMSMSLQEALPTTRALGHYLNLTSLAEMHHNIRVLREQPVRFPRLKRRYLYVSQFSKADRIQFFERTTPLRGPVLRREGRPALVQCSAGTRFPCATMSPTRSAFPDALFLAPQGLSRQMEDQMNELLAMGVNPDVLFKEISTQNVEIVLTGTWQGQFAMSPKDCLLRLASLRVSAS